MDLRVGITLAVAKDGAQGLLSLTLLLVGSVSAVVSTLTELKSLRRAAGAPEFLIFNDTVNGCEFLGKGRRDGR